MAPSARLALKKNPRFQRSVNQASASHKKFQPIAAHGAQHDSEYLVEVGMGHPIQRMNLDFDTGSSDLWVWSDRLPTDVKEGHNVFKTEKSANFKTIPGSSWNITYGDCSSASGEVGTDILTLGDISVHNQAIEIATKMSPAFVKNPSDGLLGLAFGKINTVKPVPVKTPVENMMLQGDVPKTAQLFTAYLGSYRDKKNPDKGESFYTFGEIDHDVVKASKSEIHYVPVNNSKGFWQVSSTIATVSGKAINRPGNEAIIDTGTTLAMVEDTVVDAIYRAIPGARKDNQIGGWLFPTSIPVDQLPTVQFAIGQKLFTVLPEDLQYVKASKDEWYGGIQPRGNLTFDILGDTFLKNIYAVFDQGNTRFGCVQRFEPGEKYPPSTVPAGGSQGGQSSSDSWFEWFKQLMVKLSGWFGIE